MEDAFGAILRLSGGVLATVDNSRTTESRSARIELVGERGQLRGDHLHHRLEEIHGMDLTEVALPPPVPTVRECLRAFTSAVRDESPVPIPFSEGVRAVAVVEACRRSAKTGRPRKVAAGPTSRSRATEGGA
jgi:predicted dehydrogenase